MLSLPVCVDLFACEGVIGSGYAAAGFEVWGVDNAPPRLSRNPFAWFLGDWREGLDRALQTGRVAVVHASPPCQPDTAGLRAQRARGQHLHGRSLIPQVRDALQATGLPYVIENVAGADLRDPLSLCGSMFNLGAVDTDGRPLRLERHRLFESNRALRAPSACRHDRSVRVAGSYGGARRDEREAREVRRGGYVPRSVEVQRALLGAPSWASEQGLWQSVPPAYGEHIGRQLLAARPAVRASQLELFAS